MIRHLYLSIVLFLAGGLLFTGCHKEKFEMDRLSTEVEFEPEMVLPLIYGSMDMEDLVELIDSDLYDPFVDDDGLPYYLIYGDTIISIEETIESDYGNGDLNISALEYLVITIKTVNQLAIAVEIQVYLEDENNVVLDSLFDNNGIILEPAQIDSDGKLIEATENVNSATFENEKIEILDDVAFSRVIVRMIPGKEGEDIVKIYADYTLEYEISFRGQFRLNTHDLN